MNVQKVSTTELRQMQDKEGLVIQGCGGNAQEWIDGINDLLTKEEILQDGTKFTQAYQFENDDCKCLLFPFDDSVKLDMNKLAMWRLQTHTMFGGTWLSDYVPNRLGGFESVSEDAKPDCPLIGKDGNVFTLVGIAARTLKRNHMREKADEMTDRVFASGSYSEALGIIGEYVNICSEEEMHMDMG